MTNATTEAVRLTHTVEGGEGNIFNPGTHQRFYQTEDGHTVVSSWAPPEKDDPAHVMAWPAETEDGMPTNGYVLRLMLTGDEENSVDGDDTDANHAAALAQQGFHVEQEAAA
jgi:hypothetical protein